MEDSIDLYLDALLSFVPRDSNDGRDREDYATLIHVPGKGPERVYSMIFGKETMALTKAQYLETVWEFVEKGSSIHPPVDILKTDVDHLHPVFEYLNPDALEKCVNYSDGCPGMDYFLLMWRHGDRSGTAECWDPLGRVERSWLSVCLLYTSDAADE